MTRSHYELAVDLAEVLDDLGIDYVIGGSVASSLLGEPRSTVDVDIAVAFREVHLGPFVDRVRPDFYVPEVEAARAVRERQSFNIIHNTAALKVDLFVLGDGVLDVNQIARRIKFDFPTDPISALWITSPEDQVLRKLDWYRQGGQVSERQVRDIVAILQSNHRSLDYQYIKETADRVDLAELLHEAMAQAEL